jgi:hypothetical protein
MASVALFVSEDIRGSGRDAAWPDGVSAVFHAGIYINFGVRLKTARRVAVTLIRVVTGAAIFAAATGAVPACHGYLQQYGFQQLPRNCAMR